MPISYTLLKPYEVLFTRFEGKIILADFERLRPLVLNDSDFKPTLLQLMDMRAGDMSALSSAEIRQLASTTVFVAGVKRAFVAANNLEFGLARMFETPDRTKE